MKKLPLTNIDKFEKVHCSKPWSPNCEVFWRGRIPYHFQRKNDELEGIKITWARNPFELQHIYILEK